MRNVIVTHPLFPVFFHPSKRATIQGKAKQQQAISAQEQQTGGRRSLNTVRLAKRCGT
jgi:hypothetical protein